MERHVTLLANLTSLWGAMAMLVGVSMLLLGAGALSQVLDPAGSAVGLAANLTAAMFAVIGGFALFWGAIHVWDATLLRRRRYSGRVLGLALALVNLLVLPFGTALGVYALWVLLTEETRKLFAVAAHGRQGT